MSSNTDPSREFISTAQAARQLGLSLGAVQQMVENGTLAGWKTAGGHRRIRQDSVDALLARSQGSATRPRPGSDRLQVMIVEDDAELKGMYRDTLGSWPMPMDLRIIDHGIDALIEIGHEPPDLLIADLGMSGLNGFEMIRRLRSNPLAAGVAIVAVSTLSKDEIAAEGGLPADTTVYSKPIPFHELHGYTQALVSQRRRAHNAG